ncbi:MAG: hypothetical protein AAF266_09665 [Planctomycetota bacterium]
MADRTTEPTPAQRLQAIEDRQEQLLSELDGLNDRIEAALEHFGTKKASS